jgi:hypothetical protein
VTWCLKSVSVCVSTRAAVVLASVDGVDNDEVMLLLPGPLWENCYGLIVNVYLDLAPKGQVPRFRTGASSGARRDGYAR